MKNIRLASQHFPRGPGPFKKPNSSVSLSKAGSGTHTISHPMRTAQDLSLRSEYVEALS